MRDVDGSGRRGEDRRRRGCRRRVGEFNTNNRDSTEVREGEEQREERRCSVPVLSNNLR